MPGRTRRTTPRSGVGRPPPLPGTSAALKADLVDAVDGDLGDLPSPALPAGPSTNPPLDPPSEPGALTPEHGAGPPRKSDEILACPPDHGGAVASTAER